MFKLMQWAAKALSRRDQPHTRVTFVSLFHTFQRILELNNRILENMADMGDKLGGDYIFDRQYLRVSCRQIAGQVYELIHNLNTLVPKRYMKLDEIFSEINHDLEEELEGRLAIPQSGHVMPYDTIGSDFDDVVGGKNANLAEIRNRLGITVPDGFAVTTRAFRSFFEDNDMEIERVHLIKAWEANQLTTEEASRKIMALIASGSVSSAVSRAINKAVKALLQKTGAGHLFLAVRSSGMGEDSEHTFAGQYLSLLNQPQQALTQAYKQVLASAYSPQAMAYRQQKGFLESEVVMAVACQCMIDAKVSGVLYSMDPLDPARDVMLISATWGLGAPVVSGSVTADRFVVSRAIPHAVNSLDIARKSRQLAAVSQGGCEWRPVDEALQTRMSLTNQQIRQLGETALAIERYFKCPQDIEWAFDQQGQLFILQTRPLNIRARMAQVVCDIAAITDQYPVIFSNKGQIVQNGIATGKVFLILGNEDLERFPNGAILVAKETSPQFAKVARKACGIITDVGSSTGHMATISREFRIPTIVNTAVATRMLKPDQEITLDAQENVVYAGRIKELCYYSFMEEAFEQTYEYRLLRRLLKKITPLNLVDPHAKDFTPQACRTLHDITRFIHEKAVEELIDMNYRRRLDPETKSKKLKADIPLDLIIIDIGGGLGETDDAPTVSLEQILSVPMLAFLDGLRSPGAWSSEPMSVDFGSFMSSLTRTFSSHLVSPKSVGQNLAVISQSYANISLRLGYHFNMIDAYIGEQVNDNYAYFRFMGGVTDPVRRSRRARFIYEALARTNFNVDIRGDMVIGRIKKLGAELMQRKMFLMGQLVGFTRQLDVRMTDDQQIINFSKEFEQLAKTEELMNG